MLRMRDCLKRPKRSTISKEDEVELENEALKLRSMILNFAKAKRDHKQKGLIYVNINIIEIMVGKAKKLGAINVVVTPKKAIDEKA
ncbi:hypothetical protein PVK06_047767 [Gossypium arboreum]|uniref:Uncharacterized protein n=1 Tax=Gossypium arboreum TaxID=29729 RepID=A0ABR0ME76_GOSAR|nr:hypothetical protein PVK06_047767 [Gossypium arboreum]